jgi:hypothetical protein
LIELNADYFRDGVSYVKAAEQKTTAPTLFDITDWTPKLDEAEELADEPA